MVTKSSLRFDRNTTSHRNFPYFSKCPRLLFPLHGLTLKINEKVFLLTELHVQPDSDYEYVINGVSVNREKNGDQQRPFS